MIKSLWVNLPVKNVKNSKDFFTKIGFQLNLKHGVRDDSACFMVGDDNFIIMFFEKPLFEDFVATSVADSRSGSEVLFSFDAESAEEVDDLAKKVVEAGGTLYAAPGYKDEWMYGCGFIDLDGQRWNILHMDLGKMPLG